MGAAQSGAVKQSADLTADLDIIRKYWPDLPQAARKQILGLIQALGEQ